MEVHFFYIVQRKNLIYIMVIKIFRLIIYSISNSVNNIFNSIVLEIYIYIYISDK